jgi:hypothetical protein
MNALKAPYGVIVLSAECGGISGLLRAFAVAPFSFSFLDQAEKFHFGISLLTG